MFFYGNQNLESSQKSKESQDSQNELSDNQSNITLRSRGGRKISRRGSIVEEQNRRVDKSEKKMVIVDEKNNDQECDIIMLDSLKKNQLARTSS